MNTRQEKWNKKYIGKRVGKLIITKVNLNNKISCKCLCDCGKESIKSIESIYVGINRKALSCGCSMYQYKKGNQSYKWKGFGEISARHWYGIKNGARIRNIDLEISIEDAWNKFIEQNKKCTLSNELLLFPKNSKETGTASIDRIDSNKSYNINNIRWIHKDINNMKWNLSEKDFLKYCSFLLDPAKNKFSNDCIELKKYNRNWGGYGNISGDFWYRINKNAKIRNIDLEISIEDIWDLFLKQKGCCKLTGLPLTLLEKRFTASLDRLDNNIGYTKNNIIWIHKDINCKIKKDLPIKKVIDWCKKIQQNGKLNEN